MTAFKLDYGDTVLDVELVGDKAIFTHESYEEPIVHKTSGWWLDAHKNALYVFFNDGKQLLCYQLVSNVSILDGF